MLCDGGNTVMIAVTISVAMSTRRSRIAVVIWFTPTADGAGSCVPGPRHGERFAVAGLFRGRSRVVHHPLVVVQRVTDPPDRSPPRHPARHAGVRPPPLESGNDAGGPGRGARRGGGPPEGEPPSR